MSKLDKTVWNDFQPVGTKSEATQYQHGLIGMAKKSTPKAKEMLPPSLVEKLGTMSSARSMDIPMFKDQSVVIRTNASFDIPKNLLESDTYSVTPIDIFSGYRYYPAQFENNQVDADSYLATVRTNVTNAMADSLEGFIAAKLEELKTQAWDFTAQSNATGGSYSFNTGTDVLEIDLAAQKKAMYFHLKQQADANEQGGTYNIVTSPNGLIASDEEAAKFGANNSENLQWNQSLLPLDSRFYTKQAPIGAENFNGWFVRDGAIGLVENFPYDYRQNTVIGGRTWSVSDMELPFLKVRCNIMTNNEATDATAITTPLDSNLITTTFQEQAIWCRLYLVHGYNSDRATRPSDVIKIKGLNS